MFKNRERDRLFLERCHQGDKSALQLFNDEYWGEVSDAVWTTVREMWTGKPDPQRLRDLVIACIDKIFEEYKSVPSKFMSLRAAIRRFACRYAARYIKSGGRLSP